MFERIANGWELVKESWNVLQHDKKLLLFPFLSGISCVLVLASFAVPIYMSGAAEEAVSKGESGELANEVVVYLIMFAYYFCNYFVIVFFNSALVACALIRFKGGEPTLGDGFSAAWARLPQITAWAALAATVGVILKIIESRSNKLGKLVTSLIGTAWTILTYFVVPVIVVERTGPIETLNRSASVMRKTWGESLTANFGIGLFVFLASLVGMIPLGLGIMALTSGQVVLGGLAIAYGVIVILMVSLISSAMNTIILAALYLYATEGRVPNQFDANLLKAAFAPNRQ